MPKNYRDTTCVAGELMNAAVPYGHTLLGQDVTLGEDDLIMTSNNPGEWKGPIKDSGLSQHSCRQVAEQMEIREVRACRPIIDKTAVEVRGKGSARGQVSSAAVKRPKNNKGYGGHPGSRSDVRRNGKRSY